MRAIWAWAFAGLAWLGDRELWHWYHRAEAANFRWSQCMIEPETWYSCGAPPDTSTAFAGAVSAIQVCVALTIIAIAATVRALLGRGQTAAPTPTVGRAPQEEEQ